MKKILCATDLSVRADLAVDPTRAVEFPKRQREQRVSMPDVPMAVGDALKRRRGSAKLACELVAIRANYSESAAAIRRLQTNGRQVVRVDVSETVAASSHKDRMKQNSRGSPLRMELHPTEWTGHALFEVERFHDEHIAREVVQHSLRRVTHE
jgi:hypothetical protein